MSLEWPRPPAGLSGTPPTAQRLDRTYDVAKLKADLHRVLHFGMVSQPGPYHNGEWKGISLHAPSGSMEWAGTHRSALETFRPTQALAFAPYIAEVLQEFEWKHSVRILALPPGGKIGEHTDDLSVQWGIVRVHIPVVTHPDVVFVIGGERQHWKPGELWYGDFSQVHSVENRSPVVRYHLVIDACLTPGVLSLFPSHQADEDSRRWVGTLTSVASHALHRYQCDFDIPPGIPILGIQNGGPCSIRVWDSRLCIFIGTSPTFFLRHAGEDRFHIETFGPRLVLAFRFDVGQCTGIDIRGGIDMDLPCRAAHEPFGGT